MSEPEADPRESPAQRVFLAHLAGLEHGAAAAIDDLVRAHPLLERELRELAARHARLAELRRIALPPDDAQAPTTARDAAARLELEALAAPRRASERYELGARLARGAQGVVHQVFDRVFSRDLAMKVLRADGAAPAGSRGLQRFLDEARLAATLEHPAMVPVHDLGVDAQGQPFFTMKLVRGASLAEAIEARRGGATQPSLPRLVEVLVRVAEAMAFAHDRGVLHRDLKPSNVMLGDYGEVYVMDWGLARARHMPEPTGSAADDAARGELDSSAEPPTLEGDVIGTPHYMAPEQAAGRNADVRASADVYALGAMLYHVIAGRAPYAEPSSSSSARDVLERVRAGPPTPLPRLDPAAPAELAAIAAKAMARDAAQRYVDMRELADDLRAWLDGRVVRAYEQGALADLRKWIGRNRALATSAAIALAVAIGGLAYNARTEAVARRAAEQARTRSDAQLADLKRLSEAVRLRELRERADTLWPEVPAQVDALAQWLDEARELASHLDAHERTLTALRAGTLDAEGLERQWWEGTLAALVDDLRELRDRELPDIEQRLAFASALVRRTIEDERAAWEEASRAVAADPRFEGLALEPIAGLVPLGGDARSGLQEFWHMRSGERPERDASGRLVPGAETGIVLVLLPPGRFRLGAQAQDEHAPNYDPQAEADEQPVVELALGPFFLSKYELTQGQWLRVTGVNPSRAPKPSADATADQVLRQPVDYVNWTDCQRTLARIDLALPTEAQWEYAARAGTTTPWWTGAERDTLATAENLCDQTARAAKVPWAHPTETESFEDGFVHAAPVGSLRPNAFGLHDMLGNVMEWCRDAHGAHDAARAIGDGALLAGGPTLAIRGGCYGFSGRNSRSAARTRAPPDVVSPTQGARAARALR
jgi:formylglycine-generating enzyme required for sulfatase activity